MGYPTKVQLIRRKASQQWYVNFPSALAQAMQFSRGETVEWLVEDRCQLVLNRPHPPPSALKKRLPSAAPRHLPSPGRRSAPRERPTPCPRQDPNPDAE